MVLRPCLYTTDASPLMEFFQPVVDFLEEENAGHRIGWDENCPG